MTRSSRDSGLPILAGGIAVSVLVLDAVTKRWLQSQLADSRSAVTIWSDVVALSPAHNRGGAFSAFAGAPDLARIASAAAAAVIVWALFTRQRSGVAAWSFGLIAGGALGNTADRVARGQVFDFVAVKTFGLSWPVFNFADLAIALGVAFGAVAFIAVPVHGVDVPWWWSFRSARAISGLGLRLLSLPLLGSLAFAGRLFGVLWTTLLVWLGAQLWYIGRRVGSPSVDELRAIDKRKPVLLLRAFQRDHLRISRRPRPIWKTLVTPTAVMDRAPQTFEDALVEVLATIGPTVALGRPADVLRPVGAARTYVSDDRWQDEVRRLAQASSLVALVADHTAAMRWEMEHVAIRPEHLIIVLPPNRSPSWMTAWEDLRTRFEFLPALGVAAAAIRFDASRAPFVIQCKSADPWDQLDAIAGAISPDLAFP